MSSRTRTWPLAHAVFFTVINDVEYEEIATICKANTMNESITAKVMTYL
jgi:hypothetical protein